MNKRRKKPVIGKLLGYRWLDVDVNRRIYNSGSYWLHEVSCLQQTRHDAMRVAIYALPSPERGKMSDAARYLRKELVQLHQQGDAELLELRKWLHSNLETLSALNDDEYSRGVQRTVLATQQQIDLMLAPSHP